MGLWCGAVVFYACTAGALVDLAADLGWLLNLRADVVLDGHLRPVEEQGVTSGLAELSVIQQAMGMLIDRGLTPPTGPRRTRAPRPGIGHDGPRGGRPVDPRPPVGGSPRRLTGLERPSCRPAGWSYGWPADFRTLRCEMLLGDVRRSPHQHLPPAAVVSSTVTSSRQRHGESGGVDEPTCTAQQPVRQVPGPDTKRRNPIGIRCVYMSVLL